MTKKINISEYAVPAPITSPLRLAVVSDLHDRDAENTVRAVLALSPDGVLIPGDLLETPPRRRRIRSAEAMRLLQGLTPRLPVFYSVGNHDSALPPEMTRLLREMGVHLLLNSAETWRGIHVGGVSSALYSGGVPDTAFLSAFSAREGFKLLLCHHPEYFDRYICPLPIDLTVAGHAHGGQWRFFGRGLYAPGQGLFPRYTEGLYGGRLLVSRGLKISSPIPRIRNPREIPLLVLTPGEP